MIPADRPGPQARTPLGAGPPFIATGTRDRMVTWAGRDQKKEVMTMAAERKMRTRIVSREKRFIIRLLV